MIRKWILLMVVSAALFSCSNNDSKGKFTVNGELKGALSQRVFLEELYFTDKAPEVLDTGFLKDGKFEVSALAREEGIYRLRADSSNTAYLFVNDGSTIEFKGNINIPGDSGYSFSGAANASLRKTLRYVDSISKILYDKGELISRLQKMGAPEGDSITTALKSGYKSIADDFTRYCFAYADTSQSPILSLFVLTMAAVEITKFEQPLAKLAARFPKHKGIEATAAFIRNRIAAANNTMQPSAPVLSSPEVGSMAPDITMNDVNDKPFSLSQLKGKYVLVDFWASWCGPCRDENPNIVAAYNQFKDKNFTILGVSLDKNKSAWLDAIKEDNLSWQQISDLKYWSSAAVPLYGLEVIPSNVLVDPQGKIIATNLRGSALQKKIAEVLR